MLNYLLLYLRLACRRLTLLRVALGLGSELRPTFTSSLAGYFCLLAFVVSMSGCNEVPVAQDLNQAQAHAVIAALADSGIESTAQRGKGSKGLYSVELSANDYARAILVLRDAGLPDEVRPSVTELLSSDSLLPPGREIEMLKIDRAVAGEIEELLDSHPSVVSARAVVRSASLSDNKLPPSVSIVITVREAIAEDQIKELVRQVASGVAPENISVVVENERPRAAAKSNETVKLSSFLFFWKVPQTEIFGLNMAVFAMVLVIAIIAAGLGFASGTARAGNSNSNQPYTPGDLSRSALPSGPSVTSSRLRLSEMRGDDGSSEEPGA